jgi:hypothetical protein
VRGRSRSALLWGVVGLFTFLVFVQGYQLAVEPLPLSTPVVDVVAVVVAAVVAGVASVAEPRLLSKGRS